MGEVGRWRVEKVDEKGGWNGCYKIIFIEK